MSVAKAFVVILIVALSVATLTVMDIDTSHGPASEMAQMDCDVCPDAMDHEAKPHMGNCANGASCMMNAVAVSQRPIVMVRIATEWLEAPGTDTFFSTDPTLDLPPPRA